MNSTDDDTFKMLKSITEEEARKIFCDVYMELTDNYKNHLNGLPYPMLAIHVDERLRPYGWSMDKLIKLSPDAIS